MHSRRILIGSASAVAVLASVTAGSANAGSGPDLSAPKTHQVSAAEQQATARLDYRAIVKSAKPMPMPKNVPSKSATSLERGTQVKIAPSAPGSVAAKGGLRAYDTNAGALWPLGATVNPNRQIGKLYFDINPGAGVDWRHCTATAVNSENKSTVITAGHCVVNASTKQWYQHLWFYPGYQYGAPLGAWSAKTFGTTGNYYYSGASADDMAAVVVNPDSLGRRIVNRLRGHGAWFNGTVGNYRTSLGYPVTDWRWPGYTANGEDARYCQGTDYYYSSGTWAGQMFLSCRMTGGSSGGPWLTWVNGSWMGYVNSVNSNKGGIGASWASVMFGPYFNNSELNVFNWARYV